MFEPSSDEEKYPIDADENEAKDLSLKQRDVHFNDFECSDQRYWSNIRNFPEVKKIYRISTFVNILPNMCLIQENTQEIILLKKRYQCTICNYSCFAPSHLKKHFRAHTNEKPYTCQICDVSFSQSGDLRKHRRTHTGEKPYTCQVYDKSFSRPDNLHRHCRLHMGENPYKCKVCAYATGVKSQLKIHMMRHTG